MALFKIENLSFCYPDEKQAVLRGVSFSVEQGQFIVLCGQSGCGKTTLLRQLKKAIQPSGSQHGTINFRDTPLDQLDPREEAAEIGFVFQDPENQIVTSTVWHELAFGLENMGIEAKEIRKRVAEIASFFGIEGWFNKSVHELSGGQEQLLNLASLLVMKPKVLLLDEPTSQLDPIASREFIQMLGRINQELSITVLLSEHRLDDVLSFADRLIVMENGQIKHDDDPRTVLMEMGKDRSSPYSLYLPDIPELFVTLEYHADPESRKIVPLTVKEGKEWLRRSDFQFQTKNSTEIKETPIKQNLSKRFNIKRKLSNSVQEAQKLMECKDITFHYDKSLPPVLDKCNLNIYASELLTILGGNGTGKSTLLQIMAGVTQPQRGAVFYDGQKLSKLKEKEKYRNIGYLSQNPMANFLHDTVREELLSVKGRVGNEHFDEDIRRLIHLFQISHLLDKHPYDCSGGEKQKVAMISVLLSKPKLLLIDEPTKGLDPYFKHQFAAILHQLREEERLTIVMVTHDVEFAAKHATRCALLFDGAITYEGSPSSFFSNNYFYTTSINRLVRDDLPNAIKPEDVLEQWGK